VAFAGTELPPIEVFAVVLFKLAALAVEFETALDEGVV
jgi:hypothetical protein